jgi:hypothetical protein
MSAPETCSEELGRCVILLMNVGLAFGEACGAASLSVRFLATDYTMFLEPPFLKNSLR